MAAALKNIAIVGASGNIGSQITQALLAGGKHHVTAITRPDSTSSFPSGVAVKKADTPDALKAALTGQDALVISLGVTVKPDYQSTLIEAAAAAGVPWVLPNEYGSDTSSAAIRSNPLHGGKLRFEQEAEQRGLSWIGVVTNQWYDHMMAGGYWGIDTVKRTATIFDRGDVKTVTTTLPQAGRSVAALLSLPVSGAKPCLEDWRNKLFYCESFYISQNDMLAAAQKATGTTPADWTVEHKPAQETRDAAVARFKTGDFLAAGPMIAIANWIPGSGSDYKTAHGTVREKLGLPQEDLVEVTKKAYEKAQAGGTVSGVRK